MMTTKLRALTLAIVAAVTGTLSYIAEMPPSLQNEVTMLFPEAHRGTIGLILRVIAGLAAVAATHQASHSGPQSPPADPLPGSKPPVATMLLCAALLPITLLSGCGSNYNGPTISRVGVTGAYTDPDGQTFAGGVNADLAYPMPTPVPRRAVPVPAPK